MLPGCKQQEGLMIVRSVTRESRRKPCTVLWHRGNRGQAFLAAAAALTITAKASAFSEAPPTNAPSISG